MPNETIRYERNSLEGEDYPYISLFASFSEDKYFINLLWNLENLFVNTYQRDAFVVDAYEVDGDLVIVANDLQPFDHYHLSRAADYETYVMPNGMILIDYYKNHIVDIHSYLDQRDNIGKRGFVSRRYSESLVDPIELKVNWNYEKMYVGVRFYDVNDEPIVASSGSVAISGVSAVGGVEDAVPNGTLDATSASPVVNVETPFERLIATPSTLGSEVAKWQLIVWQL